jgi:hypothetical protein
MPRPSRYSNKEKAFGSHSAAELEELLKRGMLVPIDDLESHLDSLAEHNNVAGLKVLLAAKLGNRHLHFLMIRKALGIAIRHAVGFHTLLQTVDPDSILGDADKGARVAAETSKATALAMVVALLATLGPYPMAHHISPLLLTAVRYNFPELLVRLLQFCGPQAQYTQKSLELAAERGHLQLVQLLLRGKSQSDVVKTALQAAVKNQHVHVVDFLLPGHEELSAELFPLALVAGSVEILQRLDKNGTIPINPLCARRAMGQAVRKGNVAFYDWLRSRGIVPDPSSCVRTYHAALLERSIDDAQADWMAVFKQALKFHGQHFKPKSLEVLTMFLRRSPSVSLDEAVATGRPEICELFRSMRLTGLSCEAVVGAIKASQPQVISWLHHYDPQLIAHPKYLREAFDQIKTVNASLVLDHCLLGHSLGPLAVLPEVQTFLEIYRSQSPGVDRLATLRGARPYPVLPGQDMSKHDASFLISIVKDHFAFMSRREVMACMIQMQDNGYRFNELIDRSVMELLCVQPSPNATVLEMLLRFGLPGEGFVFQSLVRPELLPFQSKYLELVRLFSYVSAPQVCSYLCRHQWFDTLQEILQDPLTPRSLPPHIVFDLMNAVPEKLRPLVIAKGQPFYFG